MPESVNNRSESFPLEVLQEFSRQRSNTVQPHDQGTDYAFAQEMQALTTVNNHLHPASSRQPRASTDVQTHQSTAMDPRSSMDPSRLSEPPPMPPAQGSHLRDPLTPPSGDHRDLQSLAPSIESIFSQYAASFHSPANLAPDNIEPTTMSDEQSERQILNNFNHLTINHNHGYVHVGVNRNELVSNNANAGLRIETNNGMLQSEDNKATTLVNTNHGRFHVNQNTGHVDVGVNADRYSSANSVKGSSESVGRNVGRIAVRNSLGYTSIDRNDRNIVLGRPRREPVAGTPDLEAQLHILHQPGRAHQPHVSGRSSIASTSTNSNGHGRQHLEHISPRASIATQAAQASQASRPAQFGTVADDGAAVAGLLKGGRLHIRDQNGFVEHTVIDKSGNAKTTLYEPNSGKPLTLDHKGKVEQESVFRHRFEEVGNQGVRMANIIGTFTNPLGALAAGLAIYAAFKPGSVAGGGATPTPSTSMSTSTSIMPGSTHMLSAAAQASLPTNIPVLSPSITPDHVPAGPLSVTPDQSPVITVKPSQ